MSFRKVLFWMHLTAGCVAGAVVLLMSASGVLLTYERQILASADRGGYQTPQLPAGASRLGVDELLARIQTQQGELPRNASLVLRSNPVEPVEVGLGREGAIFASPYDGRILGRSNKEARAVFQKITAWHRWLGSEGAGRATARAITGACNLAFLFIVASGPYLWLPKAWSKRQLRPITWFKGGLSGKARDFNWHNVFGLWMAIPLLVVVASGVPMSYTWANNLLYQITGSEIPTPNGPPGGRAEAKGGARKKGGKRPANEGRRGVEARSRGVGELSPRQGPNAEQRPKADEENVDRQTFNALWARAEQQVPGWQSISMRFPERPSADVTFTIDTGDGGQPQKRATLVLNPSTGEVTKWETFSSNSAGRQLRTWSRFAHTGEYYGIIGQTIAGVASFAGVMLVWTGLSLAVRRFSAWRGRRFRKTVAAETSGDLVSSQMPLDQMVGVSHVPAVSDGRDSASTPSKPRKKDATLA